MRRRRRPCRAIANGRNRTASRRKHGCMGCRSCDLTLRAQVNGSSVSRPGTERVAKSSKTATAKSGSAMKAAATTEIPPPPNPPPPPRAHAGRLSATTSRLTKLNTVFVFTSHIRLRRVSLPWRVREVCNDAEELLFAPSFERGGLT